MSTQRTIIVNNRFQRSHSADNSCCLTPTPYIWKYVLFETRISPCRGIWMRQQTQRCQVANFPTVFRSNYESILLSFRDTITGQTTNRRKKDRRCNRLISGGGTAKIVNVIVIIYSAITVATLTHIHWLVSILVWKLDSSMLCHGWQMQIYNYAILWWCRITHWLQPIRPSRAHC